MLSRVFSVFQVYVSSIWYVSNMFQVWICLFQNITFVYDNGNESSQLKVCFINICLHVFSSCFEVALKTLWSMFRAHFSLVWYHMKYYVYVSSIFHVRVSRLFLGRGWSSAIAMVDNLSTICKRMECVDAPSVRANYGAYLPLFCFVSISIYFS